MLCSSYIKMMPKATDSKRSLNWFTGSSDGSALSHQFLQVIILGAIWKAVRWVQVSGIWLQNTCSLWETKWSVFDSNLCYWSWQHYVFLLSSKNFPGLHSFPAFMVWKSKYKFIWQNGSHIHLIIFLFPKK